MALDCNMSKSAAKEFELSLASDVSTYFREDPNFELKKLALLWRTQEGFNIVSFANTNKWSPFVSVAFYYGCRFNAAFDVARLLTKNPAGMHISQFSVNRRLLKDLSYTGPHGWEVDIRSAPSNLAGEIATAIRGIAFPFFDRFGDMRKSRDAKEADDNWCFGANPLGWHSMLCMDAALGELAHFEQWLKVLPDFYRGHAEAELAKLRQLSTEQSNQPLKQRRARKNARAS
jgi:hypothetical protein